MALNLCFDECATARVVVGVRGLGVNATTAAEQGLFGATDGKHLDRATVLGRVIVKADPAILVLIKARLEPELEFPGLILVSNSSPVGRAVAAQEILATMLEPAEMANRIEWA